MDAQTIVALVKARLGISTAVRDTYLTAIVNGILAELQQEQGIVLQEDNASHLMFCVDYASWRYENKSMMLSNKDTNVSMPRHLQFRLHNLMIHTGGTAQS